MPKEESLLRAQTRMPRPSPTSSSPSHTAPRRSGSRRAPRMWVRPWCGCCAALQLNGTAAQHCAHELDACGQVDLTDAARHAVSRSTRSGEDVGSSSSSSKLSSSAIVTRLLYLSTRDSSRFEAGVTHTSSQLSNRPTARPLMWGYGSRSEPRFIQCVRSIPSSFGPSRYCVAASVPNTPGSGSEPGMERAPVPGAAVGERCEPHTHERHLVPSSTLRRIGREG